MVENYDLDFKITPESNVKQRGENIMFIEKHHIKLLSYSMLVFKEINMLLELKLNGRHLLCHLI